MSTAQVRRLTAFSSDPDGGNPAGVVILDAAPDVAWMQATAAEVGYSETAFLWPGSQQRQWTIRYFSPEAEVPFCGHATIATGALLAELHGSAVHDLDTKAGRVQVQVAVRDGVGRAALTSVEPAIVEMPEGLVDAVLATFGWQRHHLSPAHSPAVAFAGARHLLLPVRSRMVLAQMQYDFTALRDLMLAHDLTTVAVLWQQGPLEWQARNAFPVGGVVEDPATGAAAAAFGGWLRASGQVAVPADVTVHQGIDQGRPSRLDVHIPLHGGIVVAGDAVDIP